MTEQSSSNIIRGTWLDYRGGLFRALGPAETDPDSGVSVPVVEICDPWEWETGDYSNSYDSVRASSVSVVDEGDALERLAEIEARARAEREAQA